MSRNWILITVLILLCVAVVAAGAVWFFVLRDTKEAGGPIASTPIASTGRETGDDGAVDASVPLFHIVQAESEARFTLGEILRGEPTTVVGITDQEAGEIVVNPDAPQEAQVGTIQINARTLVIGSDMRDRAIRNRILQTDAYEFVTFTPTGIAGLPESVSVGESFSFQISGDLTIRDVTNKVTFEITVTPSSETRLEGLASATVMRADYNLTIPNVPGVADVAEQVLLELDFVAEAE